MKPIGQEPDTPSTSRVISFFHTWVLGKTATTHHTTQLINKDTSFIKESTKLSRHELSTKLSTLYSTCSKRTRQQKTQMHETYNTKKVKKNQNWPAHSLRLHIQGSTYVEQAKAPDLKARDWVLSSLPLIGCVEAQTEKERFSPTKQQRREIRVNGFWKEVLKLRFEIGERRNRDV